MHEPTRFREPRKYNGEIWRSADEQLRQVQLAAIVPIGFAAGA